MRPLLEAVADGDPHQLRDVVLRMAEASGLSDDQLKETIPSGQTKLRNRTFWAATYLRKAQALSTPKRGWVQLAERGRQLLDEPGAVREARLRQFPGWEEAWGSSSQASGEERESLLSEDGNEATPEEQIASGIEQLEANVRGELLQRVKAISPEAFERLVLQLLGALGYGVGPESRQGVRRGADGGIDGRIDEDRLGLASIYIQAKRYQEQSVGRPAVQSFYGAMGGKGASKGVFITTSTLTRDAVDCAADFKDKNCAD